MLAKHPEIQEALRKECTSISSHLTGDLPTPEELKNMKLLDNVLKEGSLKTINRTKAKT